MPAIPSFINNYKPGWKAKAVIKSSLSRFNRSETPTSSTTPDAPPSFSSPVPSSVLDIKDDRSSLDFDGGQPDEYASDILDRESRPSNVSSSPPAKLEVTLPPELRIDWFADKFTDAPSKAGKADSIRVDDLDQETKDTLAGIAVADHGLVETLEDALARNVDPNPAHLVAISGLDLTLPEISPSNLSPDDRIDAELRMHPRDSLTMLTSRHSITDTPISSALSGTTLARALISNTFAMPIDNLSEVGLTRSDSAVLPRDSLHRRVFSIASDAPPMPLDAEILYEAPKRPRRKQVKRRSSTGNLNIKALPEPPTSSRITSFNFSAGSEFDGLFQSPLLWSSDNVPTSSPIISISPIPESTTPVTPHTETAKSDISSLTFPSLPEGFRRLPDPHLQPSTSAGVSPSISTKSSTPPIDLDTKALEDVLEYYDRGESSAPPVAGATFRPCVSPIREETSSQLSTASPTRSDRRDSKRVLPVGARSPRTRSDSIQLTKGPSDGRSLSKPLHFPSQNESSAGLSEHSGSLKSRPSFERQVSDSASSHGHVPLPTSSSVMTSTSSHGEDSHRPNDDPPRNVAEDTVSANNIDVSHSPTRVMLASNILSTTPASSMDLNQSASPFYTKTQESSPNQTGHAPSAVHNPSGSSPLPVRNNSLPYESPTIPPNVVVSNEPTTSVDNGCESTTMPAEGNAGFRHPYTAPRHHAYKDDFMTRTSTLSMGSPPPYYEAVNQAPIQAGPSVPVYVGPAASDSVAGPSRLSGEWDKNAAMRDSPARARIRPRPPLPIGPRRPSQGGVLPSGLTLPGAHDRPGSLASVSEPDLSRQRSGRVNAIPLPKFQTPLPKWRGHTMDAARWTFDPGQLQTIVSKAVKQTAEASSIRLLAPEILENEIPTEIASLETLRTDIKARYKIQARRRSVILETLSSLLAGNTEEGSSDAPRLLEELSEIAASLDHLAEDLHSTDTQLAHLESLTQVHTTSALSVALRTLNTSFLTQLAENESLRDELCTVEAERDEAWRQAERIAIELDQLVSTTAENPSPTVLSNRSSRVSAHRKSMALVSKAASKAPKRRFSKHLNLGFTPSSLVSPTSSLGRHPKTSASKKPLVPTSALLTTSTLPTSIYTPSSATRALIQAQDELYTLLGLSSDPERSLSRSRSWTSPNPSPREIATTSPSRRRSIFLPNDYSNLHTRSRRSSLPPDSALAQVSKAITADCNAMLATFDMLNARDHADNSSR